MTDLQNGRLLIVEDEPDGQEVVQGLLGHYNLAIDVASTAEEALVLLENNVYVGAVIDLALPGMDGWQLLSAIRSRPESQNLPCVAMTAYHTSKVRKQAIQSGFNAYFAKPLDREAFLQGVRSAIGGSPG